jgi:hypothetical protein
MHRLPKGIINKVGFVFYLAVPVCVGVYSAYKGELVGGIVVFLVLGLICFPRAIGAIEERKPK